MELFERLVGLAADRGWRVMLVGGRGNVACRAAKKLESRAKLLRRGGRQSGNSNQGDSRDGGAKQGGFKIVGTEGITDIKNPDKKEEKELIEQINAYKPDLLFVGFGAPWQEKWAYKQLKVQNSKFKVKVVMVVGGAFDQIVDPSLRPPKFVETIGLGWFYRLIRQPWRIGRQLRLVRFAWLVLVNALFP